MTHSHRGRFSKGEGRLSVSMCVCFFFLYKQLDCVCVCVRESKCVWFTCCFGLSSQFSQHPSVCAHSERHGCLLADLGVFVPLILLKGHAVGNVEAGLQAARLIRRNSTSLFSLLLFPPAENKQNIISLTFDVWIKDIKCQHPPMSLFLN